jgi:hypothetical protein
MHHLAVVIIVPPVHPTQKAGVQMRPRRASNPQPPEPQSGPTPSTEVKKRLFWLSDAILMSIIAMVIHGRLSVWLHDWLHLSESDLLCDAAHRHTRSYLSYQIILGKGTAPGSCSILCGIERQASVMASAIACSMDMPRPESQAASKSAVPSCACVAASVCSYVVRAAGAGQQPIACRSRSAAPHRRAARSGFSANIATLPSQARHQAMYGCSYRVCPC